jgi:hypothetical protein
MAVRALLIIFSILGIAATFMPWMHYPKINVAIYGYLVDGILTGIFFTFALAFSIYANYKKFIPLIPAIVFFITSTFLAYSSVQRLKDIHTEKVSFRTDDPLIATGTAGFYEGIGIYVYGIAGAGLALMLLLGLILQRVEGTEGIQISPLTRNILIGIIILFFATWVFLKFFGIRTTINEENIQPILERHVALMGDALIKEDYTLFLNYNLPTMIQANGGKAKTIEMLRETMKKLEENNSKIVQVSLKEVQDTQFEGQKIQAVIFQEVIFNQNGLEIKEKQKMLAISSDGGNTFQFININKKSKAEIFKLFPDASPLLNL